MKGLTRIFRGPRATNTPRQTPLRQNAGYFATSSSFSVFFAEVVCDLGTTPPQTASAPPPVGGNCTTRGSDTPATRRKKASCSAKPPIATNLKCAASPPRPAQGRLARKSLPNTTPPLHRLFHEKTRPARAKTPNLGCRERAGRTISRFHDLTATQGELFRACRRSPSGALPISDQAPLVWRVPEGPEGTGGFEATRKVAHQRPGPTGVEDVGGPGGPGCGASG